MYYIRPNLHSTRPVARVLGELNRFDFFVCLFHFFRCNCVKAFYSLHCLFTRCILIYFYTVNDICWCVFTPPVLWRLVRLVFLASAGASCVLASVGASFSLFKNILIIVFLVCVIYIEFCITCTYTCI